MYKLIKHNIKTLTVELLERQDKFICFRKKHRKVDNKGKGKKQNYKAKC